ncbi:MULTISPECIES: PBSX family phage terminase large subunit [Cryobacterium]|uniref:PBSX family phage terminase large subunit n=1 Tax=Cryobacterium breve TaxID=1259258 RepID=A0ABY2J4P7_9MICO|nr:MULTISPECIES: PBSX family phage terminase large subunit [Cryobacterium]TFC92052.1 PBSX family phage terminase large subunit [Cryobacterium sp. TmT3-12]TFC99809.1 PBSX family phage terminase large subunit [Cryobacterium breve]
MNLSDIERLVSKAQILSIVDAMDRKLALWFGSVSAGKTVASLFAFLLAIVVAPRNGIIIIVGGSLQTIYQNVFVLFQNTAIFGSVIANQVIYTPGATSATILGREVLLIGAKDAKAVGRIQGATVALAYVDEAALLPEEFWNMLISRLRVDGARLLATMNPASMNHWIRKKWILEAATKNLVSFHFTMDDNPNLSEEYKADMRASFSGVFFDRMIKGEWTNAAGAVYPMWDPKRHSIPFDLMPPMQDILGIGMDYGTTNATTALMLGLTAEQKPRLVLMDEWGYDSKQTGQRLTDADLSRRFRAWLPKAHTPYPSTLRPRFIMLDPAAASFRVQLHNDLQGQGLAPWAADNSVLAGIATIGNALDNDQLLVTDRCPGWQNEVTEYRWSEKATNKGEDEVVKEDDHYLDGSRYIVHSTKNIWHHQVTTHAA